MSQPLPSGALVKKGRSFLGAPRWSICSVQLPASIAERRWVIYANYAEASMIPPGWHGWMHHRTDTPPSEIEYEAREWQKPHHPNLTGSSKAYRPAGSLLGATPKQPAKPDYDAWQPE